MALSFLYRKNGGQVQTVSIQEPPPWEDSTFFGVITDPNLPDGANLSPPKIATGNPVDTVRNATQQEIDNFDDAAAFDENLEARIQALNSIMGKLSEAKVLRAIVFLVVQELNSLRTWTRDFKAQTALASNLANFQSRVAGLATLADRSMDDARDAIENRINSSANDDTIP